MTENPILIHDCQLDDPDATLRPKALAEFVEQAAGLARPAQLEDTDSP